MKRYLIITLSMLFCASVWAQDSFVSKRLESNLTIGAGLFGETGDQARNLFQGAVLRLSYGLDIKLGGNWSVMPGVGTRTQIGNVNRIGSVGGDMEEMSLADFFCQARYHFESPEGKRMVVYIGPQFSYSTLPDTYYIDWDPSHPLAGKEKFERWDVGLQPGIVIQSGKHWQWGIEASVGLRNMLLQYPELDVTGSVHLHNLMFIFGWRF